MNITIYSGFSKRTNSTLRPSGGTTISCTLKDAQDIVSPTFIFKRQGNEPNYLMWDNRYYYVSNITYLDFNRWALSCELDILATYKANIGSTTAYIQRAATGFNDYIADGMCTNIATTSTSSHSVSAGYLTTGTGYYVLTCMSKSVAATTGVGTSWIMDSANMNKLADWFCNGGITKALRELFEKPLSAIFSLKYIPFAAGAYAGRVGSSQSLQIGGISHINGSITYDYTKPIYDNKVWDAETGEYQRAIVGYEPMEGTTPQINAIPFTSRLPVEFGDYSVNVAFPTGTPNFMKNSPYAVVEVFLPYYGWVTVDAKSVRSGQVHIRAIVDPITGEITTRIKGDDDRIIGTYTYNCSVDVPIGDRDMSGFAKAAIGAGASLIAMGTGIGMAACAKNVAIETAQQNLNDTFDHWGMFENGYWLEDSDPGEYSRQEDIRYNIPLNAAKREAEKDYKTSKAASITHGVTGLAASTFMASPCASTMGSTGGTTMMGLGTSYICQVTLQDYLPIDYAAGCGRPVCAYGTISNYSGYVQTAGASVSAPRFATQLSAALNGGIYYE